MGLFLIISLKIQGDTYALAERGRGGGGHAAGDTPVPVSSPGSQRSFFRCSRPYRQDENQKMTNSRSA